MSTTETPYAYKHFAAGYGCPECGRVMVADDTSMWCMNKSCGAFAVAIELDWKSK